MDIIKVLEDGGFETVDGYDAVLNAIKIAAVPGKKPLCSGYGVFPNGRKCLGCDDCEKPKPSLRAAVRLDGKEKGDESIRSCKAH